MSAYIALARKYRPQEFDDVIGQGHITTTLKNAIATDKISHAYLFSGPRGSGKTSTARIFAKALNCKTGPTIKPCNKCNNCREITQGSSMDVLEIDGASNRGIDEIRTLRENVKFVPASGKYKIYIIDEVHMLTAEAFNALLKTLEEPPPHVKFIFATTQPQKILATILSRCQRFDFRRLSAAEIVAKLKLMLKEEKITIDEEALYTIARSAEGSMRDAESITDQIIAFSSGLIKNSNVVEALGIVGYETLLETTRHIIEHDAAAGLVLIDKLSREGKDLIIYCKELIEHFRGLLVCKSGANAQELIELSQETLAKIKEQSEKFSLEEILYIISVLSSTYNQIRHAGMPRIALEMTLIKLINRADILSLPELLHKLEKNNCRKEELPASPQDKEINRAPATLVRQTDNPLPASADEALPVSLEKIQAVWGEFIETVKKRNMLIAMYLNEAVPVKVERNILTISFPKDCAFHKENMEHDHNNRLAEAALSTLVGQRVRITLVVSETQAQKSASAAAVAEADPAVKTALDIFGGKIITKKSH